MPGPPDATTRSGGWPWAEGPENPRTYPSRPVVTVNAEVSRAARQRADLEATMAATGQTGALVIASLDAMAPTLLGACTATTWAQGPTSVLPHADVIVLFELPATVEDSPRATSVRWDVVARVCGARCWRLVPDLDPPRVITSRWPDETELAILRGLSLPDPA